MPRPVSIPYHLETERLVLRCYDPEDAPAVFAAVNESRAFLMRYLPWPETAHLTLAASEASMREKRGRYDLLQDLTMGMFHRADGRLVGGTGLHAVGHSVIDWDLGLLQIGYWLHVNETGNGYVTEAARELTRFAFEDLGAEKVEIRAQPDNAPSRAVAERLGYQLEGVLRRVARQGGVMRDLAVYGMTRPDFLERPRG
jgi:RimJ/RimL family protein N-acetyltransferase